MRPVCPRLSSIGLWMALSVGALAIVPSPARAEVETVQTNASGQALSEASTAALQRALASHHAYQGKIDGVWGPRTEAALRQFQANNDLEATGKVDEATAQKLGVKLAELQGGSDRDDAKVASNEAADEGSTTVQLNALTKDQAKEMQQRLQLLGYYKGPIDGEVGPATRTALRNFFQHQASLASRGTVSNAAISLFGTQPDEIQRVSGTDRER